MPPVGVGLVTKCHSSSSMTRYNCRVSRKSRENAERQAALKRRHPPLTAGQHPDSHPEIRQLVEAVAVASQSVELARETLQSTVDRARAAGASWTVIAEVLGVSRQAARQRFGGD